MAMEDACAQFMGGDDDMVATIVSLVKQTDILSFVEALNGSLTSTEDHERRRGALLMAKVLKQLPPPTISQAEGKLLVDFLTSRLHDHASVTSCARALTSLAAYPYFQEFAAKVLRSSFTLVYVQVQNFQARQAIFKLDRVLIEKYPDTLVSALGREFVAGFVQQIDGEKDPRCLSIIFELVPTINQLFTLDEKLALELFEVTSCYFPITFNPSPNDPNAVTKEQLVSALRRCITSHPMFIPHCFELTFDKVASLIDDVKVDSLLTMAAATEKASDADLLTYYKEIFQCVQTELDRNADEQVQRAAVSAFAVTLTRLETDRSTNDTFASFLALAIDKCKHHLEGDDNSLLTTAGKLLVAAAGSSQRAATAFSSSIVPHLTRVYHKDTNTSKRTTILAILSGITAASCALLAARDDGETTTGLESVKDDLFGLFSSMFTSAPGPHQAAAARGLAAFISVHMLTDAEVDIVLQHFVNILASDENATVRSVIANAIPQLRFVPGLLERFAKPLVASLNTVLEQVSQSDLDEMQRVEDVLEAVTSVGVQRDCTSFVLDALLTIVANTSSMALDDACFDQVATYTSSLISRRTAAEPVQNAAAVLLTPLVRLVFPESGTPPNLSETVMKCLTTALIDGCEAAGQDAVSALVNSIFVEGTDMKTYAGKSSSFVESLVTLDGKAVALAFWPLSTMLSFLPGSKLETLAPKLLSPLQNAVLTIESPDGLVRSAECLALFFNKLPADKLPQDMVDGLLQQLVSKCPEVPQLALALGLVCKALIMRAYPSARAYCDALIALIANPAVCKLATEAVKAVVTDDDIVLSAKYHATKRLMYKQRFFVEQVPCLISSLDAADAAEKGPFLQALMTLLLAVPKQVLLQQLPTVLPLLFQALTSETDDADIKHSTFDTLAVLVSDAPDQLSPYTNTIINHTSTAALDGPLQLRLAAVQLLGSLVILPTEEIIRYKAQMIKTLGKCLGDHKRKVRQAAAAARTQWYLL
eukprot:m.312917 g.312917  ORF g.312917 m.312917 type:complete len:991 (+) comp15968_c0_seq35:186-3158(+)